jgi:hypothetical protein
MFFKMLLYKKISCFLVCLKIRRGTSYFPKRKKRMRDGMCDGRHLFCIPGGTFLERIFDDVGIAYVYRQICEENWTGMHMDI